MQLSSCRLTKSSGRRAGLWVHFPMALALTVTSLTGSSSAGFFDGPPATVGEPMFFSIYSVLPLQKGNQNMQLVADGGFTAAGPYYNTEGDPTVNPTAFFARINEASARGLGYIAHMPMHPSVINNTTGDIRPISMNAISEASLRAHVLSVMNFTLNDPTANATVSAWYTQPEELRPWKSGELNYLRIVADEIHQRDPLSRPVAMYNPNHRQSSELQTIVNQGLDWTMMGVYATDVPFNTRGARIGDGVNRIITAANNTQTRPVAVFQLSEDYNVTDLAGLAASLGGVSTAQAIRHVIRHDVYQGLVRGTDGVQIFSGCDCRGGLTTYSQQLNGYISVSEDLNGSQNLAQVFLQGENRTDFQATILSGPSSVTHDTVTIPTLVLSDIAYGSERYLFLVNSSNSPLSLKVTGLPAALSASTISDLFSNVPELTVNSLTGEMLLGMQPLEVIALKITESSTGDYNGNGIVDAADYTIWRDSLGQTGDNLPADGVRDGVIDLADHGFWKSRFGNVVTVGSAGTAFTPVPEPASLLIVLGLGTIAMLVIRHPRPEWLAADD